MDYQLEMYLNINTFSSKIPVDLCQVVEPYEVLSEKLKVSYKLLNFNINVIV
jgi:hypothetical protein